MLKRTVGKHATLLSHLIGWLLLSFMVLYYHPLTWGISLPIRFWLKQIVLLAILLNVFYFNTKFLIPKLLLNNKKLWYALSVLGLILSSTLLNNFANDAFDIYELIENRAQRFHPRNSALTFDTYIPTINLLLIGFGITTSFMIKWQHEVNLRQRLEKDKVTSELALLKSQINPHFFFNTLNNIYSYTLSDGDVARTAITKLSKMMRYVLYDTETGLTTLSQEIAFINDYLALMKLRISNKTEIIYDVPKKIHEQMIAPMLFLPFVENAFKHGVSNVSEGRIFIKIEQKLNSIEFQVTNTVHRDKRDNLDLAKGIGLANTSKRLDLLYPGKYILTTGINNNSQHHTELTLIL